MLALQRPSMGSSKPPHPGPFGYDFDGTSDFPFLPPPDPAPGPSLLDDADSKLLGDFFDGVSSDQFNGNEFFDFEWQNLPPTFMGTTSSFGGQQSSHGIHDNGFGLMSNEMPTVTSADVLAAAALVGSQNSNFHDEGFRNDILAAQDISRTLQTGPSSTSRSRASLQSMAPFPTSRATPIPTTLPPKDNFLHDSFYTDMVFGSSKPPVRQPKPEDIQWGTDSGFGAASFIAPPGQESQRRLEKDMLKQLDCFVPKLDIPSRPSSGPNNAQPSSPVISRSAKDDVSKKRRQSIQLIGSAQREDDIDPSFQPKKRRKSTAAMKADDDDEEDTHRPTRKRKQPPTKLSIDQSHASPSTSTSKRRKSTATAPAHSGSGHNSSNDGSNARTKSRENLTEDQKRENHIRSEQKRRTLIKEGFEDLGELVPELGGGGFSKSAVLLMAGDWLEELVRGNEVLREQLGVLEGRVSGLG